MQLAPPQFSVLLPTQGVLQEPYGAAVEPSVTAVPQLQELPETISLECHQRLKNYLARLQSMCLRLRCKN